MVGGGAMFGFPGITELRREIRRSVAAGSLPATKGAIARYADYLAAVRLVPLTE